MKGEALWKTKRGSKNACLEQCDLGKGPGVVKGAYAELPRYFPDTRKVQGLPNLLKAEGAATGGNLPGLDVPLTKVEDLEDIMSYGVMSPPGVVINGKVVHAAGVPSRDKINQRLTAA